MMRHYSGVLRYEQKSKLNVFKEINILNSDNNNGIQIQWLVKEFN